VSPAPYRKPRPLIARGTNSDDAIVKCAELGMPVMFGAFFNLDEKGRAQLALYRDTLASSGHSPETVAECERFLETSRTIYVTETEAEAEAYRKRLLDFQASMKLPGPLAKLVGSDGVMRASILGTPDSVAEQIAAYGADGIGIRCVTMPGQGGQLLNLDESKRSFRLLIDEVLPKLDLETLPDPPNAGTGASVTGAALAS
jgi:alkanesulfonate monooxygenase SsuD/methylene tetrahydromethanopterin reductase-like flavin-dependent oxidoreductase (luciferase family)